MAIINRGRLHELIDSALEEAFTEMGDAVAKEARRRAPVRKLDKQKRGKAPRVLNSASLRTALILAERYEYTSDTARSIATGRGLTAAQKKTRAIASLRNQYQGERIQRRRRQNQPVVLGKFVTEKPKIKQTGLVGSFLRQSTPPVKRFKSKSSEVATAPYNKFTVTGQFRARLSARGAYEIRNAQKRGFTNTSGKLQVGGRLKNSIESSGWNPEAKKVNVAANVAYAKYVEFPTHRTAAQPFLLPALHAEKRHFMGILEDKFREKGLKR